MTVLLSMLSYVPGGMGGSETYARELLVELAAAPLDVRTLVAPVAAGTSPPGVDEVVAAEYRTGPSTPERLAGLATGLLRATALRRLVQDARVVHFPFTLPVPPVGHGQRSVVTLHDVQHHDLPQLFGAPERLYRRYAYDGAARRADAVVTISAFAKRRIVHHLGIPEDDVHVAPLGVRLEDFRPGPGAREPFALYPARAWPHKDHAGLLTAWPSVRRAHPGLRLVLTGAAAAELPPLPAGVEARGNVPRAELVDLYRRAALLVFPSRYEGFGLPVLEAMAAGCPVVSSDAAALPETVGDAGVLVRAGDPDDLVRGVTEALDRSAELRERGLVRARSCSWAACAAAHVAVYRSLGA